MPKPALPSKSLTRLLAPAMGALAVLFISGCDSSPAPVPGPGNTAPRQVTVIGEGQVQGTPDTLTVGFSIEATAPDAAGASSQTSSRTNAVTAALTAQGIDGKDISTSNVSLQPQYAAADTTASIVGYRSSNSVDVKVRKIDSGPQVLGAITTAGGDATRINSVAYSIEDDSQLVSDARARAFDDAKNRAQQYAELSGMDLGKILSISETGSGPPPMPMQSPRFDAAAESVPLSPGQQTVGFSVTAVWELG